jgi:hypothetical protein
MTGCNLGRACQGELFRLLDSGKFSWGISIDNVWTYAGLPPPKSAIVPFLVSLKLSRGPIGVLENPNTSQAIEEHLNLSDEPEPPSVIKEVCDDVVFRLKEAKIDFVRAWFPWNFFEKDFDDAPFNFAMDTFVEALSSSGIDVLGVLGNGYSRFMPRGASVDHLSKYLSELIPPCEQIVRHYKGSINTWQIENEPNWWKEHVTVNWRSGLIWLEPESELTILQTLHDIVRQDCPNGKIVVNLEADRHAVKWERYSKFCDVIGLDLYPGYAHPHNTSAGEIVAVALEARKETGKQIIVAETGQPSGPGLLGYGEQGQAEYVASACKAAYSCDALSALSMWRYSDSYWKSFPMQENHFGLLTKERQPKAAWFEYGNQIKSAA